MNTPQTSPTPTEHAESIYEKMEAATKDPVNAYDCTQVACAELLALAETRQLPILVEHYKAVAEAAKEL